MVMKTTLVLLTRSMFKILVNQFVFKVKKNLELSPVTYQSIMLLICDYRETKKLGYEVKALSNVMLT